MSLRTELYGLIDRASRLCVDSSDAMALRQNLKELRTRLDQPLRVAIVGDIKAGKSTFLNTLMKADVVYTGTEETTYTVCWFRYGQKPELTVHFRDGEELSVPFQDLKKWSVRETQKENKRLNDVEYLIVYYPSEVLKNMEFIDTPGLNSVYGTNAQNTLDFLAIRSSEDTLNEAGKADAVIFAFERTLTDRNRDTLMKFHGSKMSNTSPINSIGIFTKLDYAWQQMGNESGPVEDTRPRIAQFMQNETIKHLLFSILPICAKPAEGYMHLDTQDWDVLKQIAAQERELLTELLADAGDFSSSSDDECMLFGPPRARKQLMDKLAPYGILEITDLLRAGNSPEQIGDRLQQRCGINDVRQMMMRHFGNRTFLIKAQYVFTQTHSMIRQIQRGDNSSQELRGIASYLRDETDRIASSVQSLKELKALQMYYNGHLENLDETEQDDLLRMSGEYGRLPEDRLNAPSGSSIAEMALLAQTKANQWNSKASDGWKVSSAYTETAGILSRSYSQMHYHLSSLIEE